MKKTITEKEIEKAAKSLTMDNFFGAVKEIRILGVLFHDEEHDTYFRVRVNVDELAEDDPELIHPGDSLESVLYGVFETIQKWEHPDCETCNFFREAYRSMKNDAQWKMVHKAWKHRALVSALEDWVRIPMEYILIEKIKGLSEEDVIKRAQELDNVRN